MESMKLLMVAVFISSQQIRQLVITWITTLHFTNSRWLYKKGQSYGLCL